MSKSDVNGSNQLELYGYLKKAKGGLLTSDIKWNFTKVRARLHCKKMDCIPATTCHLQFLVSRDGRVVRREGSPVSPAKLAQEIERLL